MMYIFLMNITFIILIMVAVGSTIAMAWRIKRLVQLQEALARALMYHKLEKIKQDPAMGSPSVATRKHTYEIFYSEGDGSRSIKIPRTLKGARLIDQEALTRAKSRLDL